MFHWESEATEAASARLLNQVAQLSRSADAVRSAGQTPASVTGHEHVTAGLEEFAAYWAPFLAATAQAGEILAREVTDAAGAFQALDVDLASRAQGPR